MAFNPVPKRAMPWLSSVPESQQGQDSPGAAQSLLSPAWARAGLTAARGIKGGKLQRHFMSVSEMAGRIHTFSSHPPCKSCLLQANSSSQK